MYPGSWVFYSFTVDAELDPAGFQLMMVPQTIDTDIVAVLKRKGYPISLSDQTFNLVPCTHCRVTVITNAKLQTTWNVGIYGNTKGGAFTIRLTMFRKRGAPL